MDTQGDILNMEAPSIVNTELEWVEHTNSSWSLKDCNSLVHRDTVQSLYNNLLYNNEIRVVNVSISTTNDVQMLPDFQFDSPTSVDLDHYATALLLSQLELARSVCSQTNFALYLKKRLIVLKRIFHALVKRYHEKEKVISNLPTEPTIVPRKMITGSDALIEIGVQTGLSLLFSLLRQNWQTSSALGVPSLCNTVLKTAVDMIEKLPPLTLNCDSNLNDLGINSLNQVSMFLKESVLSSTGADLEGKQLAAELLLLIATQRGSLRFLLEWIEMALDASCKTEKITSSLFKNVVIQLQTNKNLKMKQQGCSSLKTLNLYEASLLLMEEIVTMAFDYGGVSNGEMTESEAIGSEDNEVYVWGSNSSHQLAEGAREAIYMPLKSQAFAQASQIEAGQFCTFIVNRDGELSACGKGSYGRLGLGDSINHAIPKRVHLDAVVKKLSSSKRSDGHTLALTEEGNVYSWGDGDYGKLGHGNCLTQKQPKLIGGPLQGKIVKCIHAGYRHSAAVTEDGELYTWGEGDHGRLGHGDSNGRHIPTLVKDLTDVGSVACGSSHTIVVSKDGKLVWSFGAGENGRLGHGTMANVYRPKVIDSLQGLIVQKVCAGGVFSLALTTTGQVYAWGTGPCLGIGCTETICLTPTLVQDLVPYRIIDVSAGDNHVLALSDNNEVFAWGTNTMGQCGLGHTNNPITVPVKVMGLSSVRIRQISAGTSHSIAWTTPPADKQHIAKRKPFCLDLHERTFELFKNFLEKYTESFYEKTPPLPFNTADEHHRFVQLCLKLLCTNLNLCVSNGLNGKVLGEHAKDLRVLLFKLVDIPTPAEIQSSVREVISVGVSLLLPELKERVELLVEQFPKGSRPSQGHIMLLDIILCSLENPALIAALLGRGNSSDKFDLKDLRITELLMTTLLRSLGHHTDEGLQNLLKHMETDQKSEWHQNKHPRVTHLQNLLGSLQNHLLADYSLNPRQINEHQLDDDILIKHLRFLLPLAAEIFRKVASILEKHPTVLDLLFNIILESPAGAMLMKVFNSLLIMSNSFTKSILTELLNILEPLSKLNNYLPESIQEEENQPGTETPTLSQLTDQSWVWLVDLERTCSLLIGQCLGTILISVPQFEEETSCLNWLQNPILSCGLQKIDVEVEIVYAIAYMAATNLLQPLYASIDNLPLEQQTYCKLALNVPCQYDEACAVHGENTFEENHDFYEKMLEMDTMEVWSLDESEMQLLESVVRCFLICALKHTGLLKRSADHPLVKEVYKCALNLRQKVVQSLNSIKYVEDDEEKAKKEDVEEVGKKSSVLGQMEAYMIQSCTDNYKSRMLAQRILQRSLYILFFVKDLHTNTLKVYFFYLLKLTMFYLQRLLQLSLRLLYFGGQNPLVYDFFSKLNTYCLFSSTILVLVLVLMKMFQALDDVDILVPTFESTMSLYQLSMKVLVMHIYRKNFAKLLNAMEMNFWNVNNFGSEILKRMEIEKVTKLFWRFVLTYAIGGFFLIFGFAIKPIFNNGRVIPLICWTPEGNPTPFYQINYVAQAYILYGIFTNVVGFDGFYTFINIEISVQFKLLRYELENLMIGDRKTIELKLQKCIKHHQFLLDCSSEAVRAFSILLLNQYIALIITICVELYALTETDDPVKIFNSIIYLFQVGIEATIICASPTILEDESNKVATSLCLSNWYDISSKKISNSIIYMIMRSQSSVIFKAGGLFPVNIACLTNILNTGISFFTLMKNRKHALN